MKFLILIVAFIPLFLGAETVYKTVDEQGNVLFSDQPSANADKLEIEAAPAVDFKQLSLPPRRSERFSEANVYRQLLILEPVNEQTIHSNPGNLTVMVSLQPNLKQGHTLVLEMDGKRVKESSSGTIDLENIDRGSHILTARVLDAEKNIVMSSNSVTFFMRRTSILNKPTSQQKDNTITPTNPPASGATQTSPAPLPRL